MSLQEKKKANHQRENVNFQYFCIQSLMFTFPGFSVSVLFSVYCCHMFLWFCCHLILFLLTSSHFFVHWHVWLLVWPASSPASIVHTCALSYCALCSFWAMPSYFTVVCPTGSVIMVNSCLSEKSSMNDSTFMNFFLPPVWAKVSFSGLPNTASTPLLTLVVSCCDCVCLFGLSMFLHRTLSFLHLCIPSAPSLGIT